MLTRPKTNTKATAAKPRMMIILPIVFISYPQMQAAANQPRLWPVHSLLHLAFMSIDQVDLAA